MNKRDFLILVERYINNQAGPKEILLMEEYYKRMEEKGRVLLVSEPDAKALKLRVMQNIRQELNTVKFPFRWLAAAMIFVVLSAGLFLYISKIQNYTYSSSNEASCKIKPGGNKAILTLDNGATISLDDTKNGIIAKQAGINIKKDRAGRLIYAISGADQHSTKKRISYNTIETPKGGQYQVRLPDGTNVWLNASSSLKYPTRFTGKERKVELTGEGYFEVAKVKGKIFKVITAMQVVEVYGTHFNVNAYADEKVSKTTLLEGSVKVSRQNHTSLLKPGQQSVVDNNLFDIRNVNVNNVVDWRDGYFIFKEDDIRTIMRKLARWYDVDIEYTGNLDGLNFSGKVSRSKNLNEILKVLTLTKDVRFKVTGRRVTVMP